MTTQSIGILHPGEMGISIAAAAQKSGNRVCWASDGRSADTYRRAEEHLLHDSGTVATLCAECSLIISVCPPHVAEAVAAQVIACRFAGLFVDANAISPQRAQKIGNAMANAGISFADGGIVGGPAWEPGRTCLYLSGSRANEIAASFAGSPLKTEVLGDTIGPASALKMCYSAYNKGTTALLAGVLATAEQLGDREALYRQWNRDDPNSTAGIEKRVRNVTGRAWRFVGEMDELTGTFREAGLPGEFHAAAAMIYQRLARFKGARIVPPIEEVLRALTESVAEPQE